MEGTNDLANGIGPETTLFDLNEMALKAEAGGLSVVHATCIPRKPDATSTLINVVNLRSSRASATSPVAASAISPTRSRSSPSCRTSSQVLRGVPAQRTDPVGHPNPAGYDVMARLLSTCCATIDRCRRFRASPRPSTATRRHRRAARSSSTCGTSAPASTSRTRRCSSNGTTTGVVPTGDTQHAQLTFTPATPLAGIVTDHVAHARPGDHRQQLRATGDHLRRRRHGLPRRRPRSRRPRRRQRPGGARARFGARNGDPRYLAAGGLDGNGIVDGVDLAMLAANFGKQSF